MVGRWTVAATVWERSPWRSGPTLGPWVTATLVLVVRGLASVVVMVGGVVVASDALFLKAGDKVPEGRRLIVVSD